MFKIYGIRAVIEKIAQYKWEYLLIFLIAFFSDDSYWAATSGNTLLSMLRYAFVATLPFLFVFLSSKPDKKLLQIAMLISILLASFSFINGSNIGGPIMLIFSLIAAVMVVSKFSISQFSERFSEVIIFVILVTVTIQVLIVLGILQVQSGENVAEQKMYYYWCFVYCSSYFGSFLRNSGIFREPGVFMVYINMTYLLDIWLNKNGLSIKKQAIYFLGILSTLSTGGIIIWGVLFGINLVGKQRLKFRDILTVCIIGGIVYSVLQNDIIYDNFFSKLDAGKNSISVLGRLSSVTIPLKMIINSPIWGYGTVDFRDEYIKCGMELYHTYIDPQGLSTNSILNASAVYGIWYGIFIMYGFISLAFSLAGNNRVGFILSIVAIVMAFSNEAMQYSLIFYILIFYGLKKKRPNPALIKKNVLHSV